MGGYIIKKTAIVLTIFAFTVLILCNSAASATINNTTNIKVVSAAHFKDLVVSNVTAPTIGVKGQTITLPNTIKNQGNTATTGFYVNYYLRASTTSTKYYIGKRYISSLAAGASNKQNTVLTIPTTVPSASYYILVYADSTNLIKESNENNNVRYSTTKISVQSSTQDLIISKITAPTIGVKNKTITVPNTIKNQGNTAINTYFYVDYYLINRTLNQKYLPRRAKNKFSRSRS